jgi:MerR family transcriptional regulator, light-induced transcriptional regulator
MTSPERSYAMGVVAERTGLTPALIRTWESRYGAVSPDRTESGHRRYSEQDVRRLQLLKVLVDDGRRISSIAGMSDEELRQEISELEQPLVSLIGKGASMDPADAIEALRLLDRERFRSALEQASLRLGRIAMFDRFLAPLMKQVGDRCQSGDLRMVHEHLATAEVRGFLDGVAGAFPPAPGAPALVVGTPAWQHHELGALLAAASAQAEGWRVIYLGPNLPATELAAAVIEVGARALALSVTLVEDGDRLLDELRALRRLLPERVEIVIGGRAARTLIEGCGALDVTFCPTLPVFREELGRLRARGSGSG